MDRKLAIAILFHLSIISFIIYHFARVVNWYVLLSRWYYFIPIVVLPFLPPRYKKWYSLALTYAVVTGMLTWANWSLASANLLVSEPLELGAIVVALSIAYAIHNRRPRALLMALCCLTGIYLAMTKSLLALYLHVASVGVFTVWLFNDLHVLGWSVSYILAIHRHLHRVV